MLLNEIYFYTATIYQWKPLIRDYNFEGIIIDSLSYLHKEACIKIYGFVIMPNHIHFIWELKKHNGKESAAASLMKFTAKQFQKELKKATPQVLDEYKVAWNSRNYNFWQPDPDWFLLTKTKVIEQKLHYIHTNPLQEKWGLVKDPCDYKYSSANFYEKGVKEFNFLYDYRDWCE